MPKLLKTLLKITGVLVALLLLAVIGVATYIAVNQEKVIAKIIGGINNNLNGQLVAGKIDADLVSGFPGASVSLQNVALHDSAWATHKHSLLTAKEMHVSVNFLSLLKGAVSVSNISIKNAVIDIYSDEQGYSNTEVFRKRGNDKQGGKRVDIGSLELENVRFVYQNVRKSKLFNIHIVKLNADVEHNGDEWSAVSDMNAKFNEVNFNTANGSFLKNKTLHAALKTTYNTRRHLLTLPSQGLLLDNDKVYLEGHFDFSTTPPTFALNIHTPGILYKHALALVSPNISKKINMLDLKDPVALQAMLSGPMKYRDTPMVKLIWKVNDNTLTTPAGIAYHCSMEGSFTNVVVPGQGHNDPNSAIALKYIKADWQGIPVRSYNVYIRNLLTPTVSGKLVTAFQLPKLNTLLNGRSFRFRAGTIEANVLYRLTLDKGDIKAPSLAGTIDIAHADIDYLPRQLLFTNSTISLYMNGEDLFVKQARLNKGRTSLVMKGAVKNLMSRFYTNPEKIVLEWRIESPLVDIGDFSSFIGNRRYSITPPARENAGHKPARSISAQLDKILDKSEVYMAVRVDKVVYRRFAASDVNADIMLKESGILLQNVRFAHAGGLLKLDANLGQGSNNNRFTVKSSIEHVNVKEFFAGFENFGQDAITDTNIRGTLSADVNMAGSMNGTAKIVPASFDGKVSFKWMDGALVHFRPFEKMGKIIFRNRDMSNVTFKDLQNTLEIKSRRIVINPMYIASSALTAHVQGVYAFNNGTDIKIDVSLRDPKKGELNNDGNIKADGSLKGIVLHFNAVDGDDGNVKIKWSLRDKKD